VGIPGNQSVSVRFTGANVIVSRTYVPRNQPTATQTATMAARFDGNAVSGSGPEQNSGGRSCTISLTRSP
jgi:hypothetical protein